MLIGGIFGFAGSMSLYGIEAFGSYTLSGMVLSILFLYKGIIGFGLWTEKDWAIKEAIIDAIIGLVFCVLVMFGLGDFLMGTNGGRFSFRFEILVLVPYLMKMVKIRDEWTNRGNRIE